jgi:16S rRNA (guanine527-N7)-methyltransferase
MMVREIESAIVSAGLPSLSPSTSEQLATYLELLLRWNSKLNLTAVREPSEIIRRHFVECVQCAQAIPGEVRTLLDFGSGAGLPGIPISIVRPEINVILGESQGKKSVFLREAVRTLRLNAEIYEGRIEKMPPERAFDAITLRAVDKMADACSLASQKLAPGGWLLVFATDSTRRDLESALPQIEWIRELAVSTLKQGVVLIGQKQNVSRGTP